MKVKYTNPALPDGEEIFLTGLNAVLPNNKEVELDPEVVKQYEALTGKVLKENRRIKVVRASSKKVDADEKDEPEIAVDVNEATEKDGESE